MSNILMRIHSEWSAANRTAGGDLAPGAPGPGAPGNGGAGALAMPLPASRMGEVNIRPAVAGDIQFLDYLQKMHGHMVGFFPRKQLEKNIADGEVVIAEDGSKKHVGYCIYKDNYLKRDEVGICYQLNVLPIRHRSLVGATLIKAVFERLPLGVKLFCCWCAQDIQANYFWESIGFIPLAFRTGSRSKQRIHIFWQRRVREDDDSTPYWFPYKTQNGAVREDRIAIPIPPGHHWRDPMPVILPEVQQMAAADMPLQLPGGAPVKARPEQSAPMVKASKAQVAAIARSRSKHLGGLAAGKAAVITRGGVRYIDRADAPEEVEAVKPRKPRNTQPRAKNDPELESKARDLRDEFLEQVNANLLLPPGASGKYDVSRQLAGGDGAESSSSSAASSSSSSSSSSSCTIIDTEAVEVRQLPAAA